MKSDAALLKNNFFIKRISAKFVVSSVAAMIFLYAGSLIDTLIVGTFLGESGLSAMSLVSPVYLVYYTIGATVGIGASIAASRYLGKGETDGYRRSFTLSSYIMVGAAMIMTVAGYALLELISKALAGGEPGEQYNLVRSYLAYYIPGGALNLIAYIPLYFLKTDGRPRHSSGLFALSALINVVFSWVFMNPEICNMGIGGASLATSISMGISAIIGFVVLLKGPTELRLVKLSESRSLLKEMVAAGIPNGLSNLLESARILLVNMLLLAVGAAALLPCYTVVRNVSDLLYAIIVGVSSALLPMIGVFFGERDYVNERAVFRLSVKVGLMVMIPLVLLTCLIPEQLFYAFGVSQSIVIAEGRWALPLACAGLIVAYVNTLYTGYLTSIKREKLATTIVILRLFVALAAFAVPLAFAVGPRGIWASLSLAELVTLLIFLVIRQLIRKKNKHIDGYFLDTSPEQEADITFSVKNDVSDIVFASEKVSAYCTEVDLDRRRSIRAGNAIEEILVVLIQYCLGTDKENYVDVRVCKIGDEVLLRFRYVGEVFDPIAFLHNHQGNEEMEEQLLGITMIEKTARLVDFRQTLGANTLMLIF